MAARARGGGTGSVATTAHPPATLIQARHRVPERTLGEAQALVCHMPQPKPLYNRSRGALTQAARRAHDHVLMQVKLHEDIARSGRVDVTYDCPVQVNGRYVMSPSPISNIDKPGAPGPACSDTDGCREHRNDCAARVPAPSGARAVP